MANTGTIVSKMSSIQEVLIDKSIPYLIPDFQRDFVWGEEEARQLWDDMREDTDSFNKDQSELEGYLLGNIVLIQDNEGNKSVVVDGQQRLTTLTLIGRALQIVIKERLTNNEILAPKAYSMLSELTKTYSIVNDSGDILKLKIQHDKGLNFGQYYQKLIKDDDGSLSESDATTKADKNINTVYESFYENISELDNDQLFHFYAYYRLKIMLIVTSAPTEAKAFQLFEILNDRGRSLEPMDLIKNIFLKAVVRDLDDSAKDQFNENWKTFISNLQKPRKAVQSSTFLKYYILAVYGENCKTEDLYKYFKEKNLSGNEVSKFVDNMVHVSDIYAEIENKHYNKFLNDVNMKILFEILKIKQFNPILMLMYDETEEVKKKVLDHVTRLGAAILFSYNQTNKIESLIPGLIRDYNKEEKVDKKTAIQDLCGKLEEQIDSYANNVKSLLQEKNHAGKGGNVNSKATSILKFIDVYFNQNQENIFSTKKGEKPTIEHILPQTFDDHIMRLKEDLGFESKIELKNYMNRIGNLTLIASDANSSMGNATFDEKKQYYEGSQFILTSTIVTPLTTPIKNGEKTTFCNKINSCERQYGENLKYWTKALIEKRSKDIADLMYKILTKQI